MNTSRTAILSGWMTQAKRISRVVFGLSIVALTLSACGKQEESKSIETRGYYSPRAADQRYLADTVNLSLNGIVFADEQYQEEFEEIVKDYLMVLLPREYVGHVSARAESNTGVFIGGRVELEGRGLQSNMTRTNIASSGVFQVRVFDAVPGQTPQPIPPITYRRASGYVQGNFASVRFTGDYGSIELEGQFDTSRFQGEIRFDNQTNHDGSRGAAGTIGFFDIPTCQFFRCQ